MKTTRTKRLMPLVLALGLSSLLVAGCGGGGVYGDDGYYAGDVEVDNQTDLTASFQDLYFFEMAPAGTPLWTGNLLPHDVFPGEIFYVGTFDEDYYDAEADLDFTTVPFFDVLVEDGLTTTFEVF